MPATALKEVFTFKQWTVRYRLADPKGEHSQGKGKRTIVFIHGTPWSSEVFQPFTDALLSRGGYRILLYDLAGYGQSQHLLPGQNEAEVDTSVKTQAQLLAELLKHLSIERPDVIAHDIAGAIALRTHLIHRCDFESLLLLDTNAVLPWGDGFYKLVRSEPEVFEELPHGIYEAMLRAVIRSACYNPKKLDSGWEDLLADPWVSYGSSQAARQSSFVRQIAQANDADVAEMLDQSLYQNIKCPVKILWGEEDQWIPREKMDQLAGMLKHVLEEFVVVPEAGHLVMIDQPVRVASELFSWLDKEHE